MKWNEMKLNIYSQTEIKQVLLFWRIKAIFVLFWSFFFSCSQYSIQLINISQEYIYLCSFVYRLKRCWYGLQYVHTLWLSFMFFVCCLFMCSDSTFEKNHQSISWSWCLEKVSILYKKREPISCLICICFLKYSGLNANLSRPMIFRGDHTIYVRMNQEQWNYHFEQTFFSAISFFVQVIYHTPQSQRLCHLSTSDVARVNSFFRYFCVNSLTFLTIYYDWQNINILICEEKKIISNRYFKL